MGCVTDVIIDLTLVRSYRGWLWWWGGGCDGDLRWGGRGFETGTSVTEPRETIYIYIYICIYIINACRYIMLYVYSVAAAATSSSSSLLRPHRSSSPQPRASPVNLVWQVLSYMTAFARAYIYISRIRAHKPNLHTRNTSFVLHRATQFTHVCGCCVYNIVCVCVCVYGAYLLYTLYGIPREYASLG